jgi:hypothetical protein
VGKHAAEVAHCAGWHKQSSIFAGQLSTALLQQIDGRIFAINIVTKLGLRHGIAHFLRRQRYRVTTQVNSILIHIFLFLSTEEMLVQLLDGIVSIFV